MSYKLYNNINLPSKIACVILAAGASKRMGSPKQLLPWGNVTLLEHSLEVVNSVFKNVYVVLGANAELIQKNTILKATVLHHSNWKQGLGSSIAYAVTKVMEKNFDGILFVLADQPFITNTHLQSLQEKFQEDKHSIITSQFGTKLGVPAIFSKKYFNLLKKLDADEGAKHIIKENKKNVSAIPAENLITDIDTKEKYREAYKLFFGIEPKF